MNPKLSIIIPCFNCEDTLDVALRSLELQQFRDFEAIAIDDCSTDNTRDVLADWQKSRPWLTVIENQENVGIGSTRNIAMNAARGDYLGFLDADDWVSEAFFGNLFAAAEASQVDFIRCDHTRTTDNKRVVVIAPEHRRGVNLDPVTSVGPAHRPTMVDYPYSWAGLYRRSFLRNHDIRFMDGLHSAEDRLLMWRLHLEAASYRCISECGYFYRRESDTTLTRTGDERQLHFFEAIAAILDYLESRYTPDELLSKAYRQSLALIVLHFEKRERLTARTWQLYRERSARCLERVLPKLSAAALADFGERRMLVLDCLQDPQSEIPEEALGG